MTILPMLTVVKTTIQLKPSLHHSKATDGKWTTDDDGDNDEEEAEDPATSPKMQQKKKRDRILLIPL